MRRASSRGILRGWRGGGRPPAATIRRRRGSAGGVLHHHHHHTVRATGDQRVLEVLLIHRVGTVDRGPHGAPVGYEQPRHRAHPAVVDHVPRGVVVHGGDAVAVRGGDVHA